MSFPINVVVVVEGEFTELPELPDEDVQRDFSVGLSIQLANIFGLKVEEVAVSFTSSMTPTVSVPPGIFVFYPSVEKLKYREMETAVESARNKLNSQLTIHLVPIYRKSTWIGGQLFRAK